MKLFNACGKFVTKAPQGGIASHPANGKPYKGGQFCPLFPIAGGSEPTPTVSTIEVYGRATVGENLVAAGLPVTVTRVVDQILWDSDRIDDCDEFGREPGWYSTVEIQARVWTADEQARQERAAAEQLARQEQVRAEAATYQEQLAEIRRRHVELIVGFAPASSFNHEVLRDLRSTTLGQVSQPGRGISDSTELTEYRDASGTVLAVSLGCPVDFGPSYWLHPTLLDDSAAKKRIWSWWNPTTYGADTYPGPGVPRDQLQPAEVAEVDRLDAARLEAIRAEQLRTLRISAEYWLKEQGLVALGKNDQYTTARFCPVKALHWSLEITEGFAESIAAHAAQQRSRSGNRVAIQGLVIRVVLPAEAFDKLKRKPAPVGTLPTSGRLHNFATAAIRYERLAPGV